MNIFSKAFIYKDQVPVVEKLDGAIHQKNHYPVDKCSKIQLHKLSTG